jgi:hypothetical protein
MGGSGQPVHQELGAVLTVMAPVHNPGGARATITDQEFMLDIIMALVDASDQPESGLAW